MENSKRILLLVSASHAVNHLNGTAITFLVGLTIANEMGLSYTQIGLIAASAQFSAGFLQIGFSVAGRYYTRKILLATGNAVMGVGSIIAGLAGNFYQLVTSRLVWGVGSAAQHPVGASMISDHFESRFAGRALGTHSGIAYLGNVAGPPLAVTLSTFFGWRVTLVVLAVLTVSMVAPLILGIKEGGVHVVNDDYNRQETWKSILQAFRNRDIMLITLAQVVVAGGRGLGVTVVFLPPLLAREVGLDNYAVGLFISIFLLGGSLGPVFYGWLSDKWARKPVTIWVLVMVGLFTYMVGRLREPYTLLPILFILGSVSLSVTSLLQAYLAEVTEPSIRDIAFGLYFTKGFGFTTVWSVVVGFMIDLYGFGAAFSLMAVFTIPAALLVLLVSGKSARGQKRGVKKDFKNLSPHIEL